MSASYFVRRLHVSAFVPFILIPIVVSILGAESPPASQSKAWEDFSGEKALAHVQRLVDFGPRPPGSDAIEKSRDYIDNQLRVAGRKVNRQAFTHHTLPENVSLVHPNAKIPSQSMTNDPFL